eukprot:364771-Chlamydomonas_euryale.AAC.8
MHAAIVISHHMLHWRTQKHTDVAAASAAPRAAKQTSGVALHISSKGGDCAISLRKDKCSGVAHQISAAAGTLPDTEQISGSIRPQTQTDHVPDQVPDQVPSRPRHSTDHRVPDQVRAQEQLRLHVLPHSRCRSWENTLSHKC